MSKPNNNQNQLQYHKVHIAKMENVLDFVELKSFCDFVQQNSIRTIFYVEEKDTATSRFASTFKGTLVRVLTEGYQTLEDYKDACSRKFENAQQYYEAIQKGFSNLEEYQLAAQSGLKEKQELEKLRQEGYIDGLQKFNSLDRTTLHADIAAAQFTNPAELKTFVTEKGFIDFAAFYEAIKLGFADNSTFTIAKDHKFKNAADYDAGRAGNFINGEDYYVAKEIGAPNYEQLMMYGEFEAVDRDLPHDACALIILLSKAEQLKKISINKLYDHLNKHLETYKDANTEAYFSWFKTSIHSKEDMIEYITTNERIKKLGTYDTDGEYFETKRLQQRKVVIDGSNVAHNSKNGHAGGKPLIDNVIKVVNELRKRGFEEIKVISDASLKHKITDHNKLNELKKLVEYLEAPAERAADLFIISYVRHHHCLLLSNDTFREWKAQDLWVAENIDFYRLSFLINQDSVLLPDVKD
jgi:hypothetical protein